jgi:class 3 adenylate cyclase
MIGYLELLAIRRITRLNREVEAITSNGITPDGMRAGTARDEIGSLRNSVNEMLNALQTEREKSEALLENVIPFDIVKRLKAKEPDISEDYDEVTVLVADIVGFTAWTASVEPARCVAYLNDVYSKMDVICETYGVEKIKTIGDAYGEERKNSLLTLFSGGCRNSKEEGRPCKVDGRSCV